DVAVVLSKLLGRTITYSELSFDENKDAMIRAGVPAQIAEMNAQAFSLTADGDAEGVTSDVPSPLGRPARPSPAGSSRPPPQVRSRRLGPRPAVRGAGLRKLAGRRREGPERRDHWL